MKKTALLHPALSEVIASLGHKDLLVVADAGLPIPPEAWRIDLALTRGVPGFIETLRVILEEMEVENAILAAEASQKCPYIQAAVQELLTGKTITYVPHEELKEMTHQARAIIRTGECTPYANAILVAGVVF